MRDQILAAGKIPEDVLPRLNKFIPYSPWPKQWVALCWKNPAKVTELFYGGAAGPGKSQVLLMAAAQYVDMPQYRAILIRRTWVDLNQPGGLIPRSKEWWDNRWWNESKRCWTFPSGAIIQFMHMEHPDDRFKLKGAQAHFIGYDELTEFPSEEMYSYAFRSLRKERGDPIPLRLWGASNPGGPGHEWVKRRFIGRLRKGEDLKNFLIANPYDKSKPHECLVVLGTMEDNPSLDQSYSETLDRLSALERRRQKFGDWDAAAEGSFFNRENFPVIDAIPDGVEIVAKVRAWDRAASTKKDADYTVGVLAWLGSDGIIYIVDVVRGRWTTGEGDDIIVATAEADGIDTLIWGQQDPAAAGKGEDERMKNDVLLRFNYFSETVATNRKGAKALRARPLARMSEQKRVKVLPGAWNDAFLSELEQFTEDGSHQFDDQVDPAALAARKLTESGETVELQSAWENGREMERLEDEILDNLGDG